MEIGDNLMIAAGIAFAAGLVLGWTVGRMRGRSAPSEDMLRHEAHRELAAREFAKIREAAHQIVGLANKIASSTQQAEGTAIVAARDGDRRSEAFQNREP